MDQGQKHHGRRHGYQGHQEVAIRPLACREASSEYQPLDRSQRALKVLGFPVCQVAWHGQNGHRGRGVAVQLLVALEGQGPLAADLNRRVPEELLALDPQVEGKQAVKPWGARN